MRLLKLIACAILLMQSLAYADPAPLQIKDFKFNVSEKEFMAANKYTKNLDRPSAAKCKNSKDSTLADRICSGAMILANKGVVADFYFFNDRLYFMKFGFIGDKLPYVLNVLNEKFGPPTSTSDIILWRRGGVTMGLQKNEIETVVALFSDAYVAEKERRKQLIVKQGAKGL